MDVPSSQTRHGSCVDIGGRGLLILGPSGAGKSRLALRLILDPPHVLPPATLVGDDRLLVERQGDHVVARPAPALAGLIEVRYLGIRRLPHLAESRLCLAVDLGADGARRLPTAADCEMTLHGVHLPRIAVPAGDDAALLVAAALMSAPYPLDEKS